VVLSSAQTSLDSSSTGQGAQSSSQNLSGPGTEPTTSVIPFQTTVPTGVAQDSTAALRSEGDIVMTGPNNPTDAIPKKYDFVTYFRLSAITLSLLTGIGIIITSRMIRRWKVD